MPSCSDTHAQGGIYEIKVRGHLDVAQWTRWFEGMQIMVNPGGETILQGYVPDQAALYGMLSRLRDLALSLISVNVVGDA